jgi:hypothetical protein
MSKLKAFLIEMQQDRKEKGQIMKYLGTYPDADLVGQLEVAKFSTTSGYYAAMQLVVCDVEAYLSENDMCFNYKTNVIFELDYILSSQINPSYKIISSHPPLPNTAPLSDDFVLDFVSCQGRCEVEYDTVQVCSVCGKMPIILCESECLGMPIVPHYLRDKDNNPLLRIVPLPTVIDEETGENVLKRNGWTDEDMEAAHLAGQKYGREYWTDESAASDWLFDYKNSKK